MITKVNGLRLIKTVQQFRPRSARGVRPFVNASGSPFDNGDGTHGESIEWLLADGNLYTYVSWHEPLLLIEQYDNQLNLYPGYDARSVAGGLFYNYWMRCQCFSKSL
jgi:hypothetical protein